MKKLSERQKKRLKQKLILGLVAVAVILVAAGILALKFYKAYVEEHTPSTNVMSLSEYYNVPDGEAMVIIDEKIYQKNALWLDDMIYIDPETVEKMYTDMLFYAASEDYVFYTTPKEVWRMKPGEKTFLVNDDERSYQAPPVRFVGEELYVSAQFLENCGMNYKVFHEPERVMITRNTEGYLCNDCKGVSQIRTSHDIKADILKETRAGDRLRVVDGGGVRENGFIKVMSEDGVRGYILESELSDSYYYDPPVSSYEKEEYKHNRYDYNIYLGWQLVYTTACIDSMVTAKNRAPEMNVVSPTWFFLNSPDGELVSYASKEYVNTAHSMGMKVWAVVKNDPIEGHFSGTEDSHLLLSSTAKRRSLTDKLIAACREYGIDGLNIDFEMLKVDSGVYFTLFLRELSIRCREEGIVLSVDDYVPQNFNAYYDLKEQAKVVDYIVIMGYDEHYSGSASAGSVSSLNWFADAIKNTLEKTNDPKGLIMGVPFYTRLWKEKDGSVTVDATIGMDEAEKIVTRHGADKTWHNREGQYYSEYSYNGAQYKIWLEDFASLEAKAAEIKANELAGIAAWKLGDESAGTWTVLKKALEKK